MSMTKVPCDQPRVGVGVQRRRVRQVVPVVRPVGRVEIDHYVRVPASQQRHKRPRLGRVELHEVAIQIETPGVLARPDTVDRPVLLGAVVEAHVLVAEIGRAHV